MRTLLNTALLIFLFMLAGCKAPDTNAQQVRTDHTVTGTLTLYLQKRDAVGLYVSFELKEHATDVTETNIAQSGFTQIAENPIQFSLAYPPESINQQNSYTIITTVAEDPNGKKEIATMSSPVLTQGYPSDLNMAIQPPPKPIE